MRDTRGLWAWRVSHTATPMGKSGLKWGQSAEAPWLSHWGRTPMSQCHGEPVGPRLHRERRWDLLRMAEVQGARLPAGVKRPLPFFCLQKVALGVAGGRESLFEWDL